MKTSNPLHRVHNFLFVNSECFKLKRPLPQALALVGARADGKKVFLERFTEIYTENPYDGKENGRSQRPAAMYTAFLPDADEIRRSRIFGMENGTELAFWNGTKKRRTGLTPLRKIVSLSRDILKHRPSMYTR